MSKTKKIVLFIVEGMTDETSLSLILSKLISDSNVQFHVIKQDITSETHSNGQNIIRKIDDEVKKFIEQNIGLKKTDIKEIIHLVDTDGAFIKPDFILESKYQSKILYRLNSIVTSKRESIIERNEKKSSVLNKLSSTNHIGRIPYKVYYFSCNLEHVLHNSQNTTTEKKCIYSYQFVDQYAGREKTFVTFISQNDFATPGDYKESWQFIRKDFNSLNRYCNFHLYFES